MDTTETGGPNKRREGLRSSASNVDLETGLDIYRVVGETYPSRFDFLGKVALFMFLLITVVYRLHVPMIQNEQVFTLDSNAGTQLPQKSIPVVSLDRLGRIEDTFSQTRYSEDIPEDARSMFEPKSEVKDPANVGTDNDNSNTGVNDYTRMEENDRQREAVYGDDGDDGNDRDLGFPVSSDVTNRNIKGGPPSPAQDTISTSESMETEEDNEDGAIKLPF